MGRPQKFNRELGDKILSSVRAGWPKHFAAEHAGVHRSTVHDWEKRGAGQKRGALRQFSDGMRRARAEAVGGFHDVVACAALGGNVHAAEWLLERAEPTSYGLQVIAANRQSVEQLLDVGRKVLPEEYFFRLLGGIGYLLCHEDDGRLALVETEHLMRAKPVLAPPEEEPTA